MNEYPQVTYINNQDDWYEFLLFEQYWSCLDDRKNAANVLMKSQDARNLSHIRYQYLYPNQPSSA